MIAIKEREELIRVVAYVRVSSEQDQSQKSFENQCKNR